MLFLSAYLLAKQQRMFFLTKRERDPGKSALMAAGFPAHSSQGS